MSNTINISPADEQALKDDYQRYLEGCTAQLSAYYSDGIPLAFDKLPFWIYPVLELREKPDGSTVIEICETSDRLEAHARDIYDEAHKSGWVGDSSLNSLEIVPVTSDIVLLETTGTRSTPDGTVVNRWGVTYGLKRTPEGWRHFAMLMTSSPRPTHAQWLKWIQLVAVGGA